METKTDLSEVEKGAGDRTSKESSNRRFTPWLNDILRGFNRDRPEDKWRQTRVLEVESNPEGWPRVAAVIDSEANFMIFRKFGYLRTRLIVWHQDRLRELENLLGDLDLEDFKDDSARRALCCRQGDDGRSPPKRKLLFQELSRELELYDDLLKRSAEAHQYDVPSEKAREAMAGLIWNDAQLCHLDRSYIEHVDDLVAICSDKESGSIHGMLLDLARKTCIGRSFIRFLLRGRTQRMKLQGASVLHLELFDKRRFDGLVAFLFTMVLVISLMGPVMILYRIRSFDGYLQLVVALAFTTMFAGLCASATSAKRHEICAATAAYCAVLLVFLAQSN
ncbi:hypothetical protein LTR10_023735 [Elasticomyces elasticus]|uniref:DUF6594 domain-containing protein n=1 Tax=Exophiala sideris TaxID=1016849 RepID=A0ABR0J0P1_9EURO|nr:hypothetical protein LTR10_023735 [Elasticomyces elasticus]KAK5023589.1 hypothetical protein LTS07_009097 [Exophiala sideris]KAK5029589.1 hypothetical protein LTR13_008509 [Exophiala sideris]KAK5053378.1 hypothetical protein LTR69_009336 [Exophiala sideris]KAK5179136.1 hypothetical protein LTR44_008290 [Eurotiomycetes sp. CCFEE 6388]